MVAFAYGQPGNGMARRQFDPSASVAPSTALASSAVPSDSALPSSVVTSTDPSSSISSSSLLPSSTTTTPSSFSSSTLSATATPTGTGTPSPQTMGVAIGSVAAVVGIIVAIIFFAVWVRPRMKRAPNSEKGSGFFSRLRSGSGRGDYSSTLQPSSTNTNSDSESFRGRGNSSTNVEMELDTTNNRNSTVVDRHTSVRSVMTLPAYSLSARETEQVLGREGERAGVDVVLEAPETFDEEEERREEEMSSLYRIRQARREEATAREERRRQRTEARERGDMAALSRIHDESRREREARQAGTNLSSQLIAEHQSRPRQQRVSSVSYFDLGVARADGSRVRSTSVGSDRGLLSSAASMATGGRERGNSVGSGRSSISSVEGSPDMNDYEVISLDNRSRSSSVNRAPPPQISVPAPAELPPNYDRLSWGDAPPYSSPVQSNAPPLTTTLSNTSVPSIQVTSAVSPAVSPIVESAPFPEERR